MGKRYELTDEEWKQIKDLFPKENTGKRGRQLKDSWTILNTKGMVLGIEVMYARKFITIYVCGSLFIFICII